MEFSDILTLIGSYCFPIVMCIAFFWRQYKSDEQHKEEMKQMSDALNNNTLALQKLIDKLEATK